ncbi:helix-turn-helix transcriptional regulator [Microbulbifer rhizosphaerae]|uniref:DNA-binding CsgD family transcriptional regulator n=1 Tax=Microbulbifer rhizosphaerae TaxID=1562603 RepID=A0A7W4WBH5_9GAMM|nr:helix-turn-helix transcriptional regulator [Microbulbifer rhizosphaerae]MBB3060516.1 DNA-binding CsgD family transcriptional regulator [Microbulbifer rhizosphaerae]
MTNIYTGGRTVTSTLSTEDGKQQIWDHLAEIPASRLSSEGLYFLLESISALIGADHGYWLSAVCLEHLCPERDYMLGWRPGPIFFYKELPTDRPKHDFYTKEVVAGKYEVDESTLNHIRQAGQFRGTLMRDHVSETFFDTAHYHVLYTDKQISDTLFVVAPAGRDAEVYFCFNRMRGQQPFGQTELSIAMDILRPLAWFHRKVLLAHGLLIADSPLTPSEKKVLHLLLTGLAEKEVAEKLELKPDTVHKHVMSIYRKFNVSSRAALMTLWLGQAC